MRKRAGGLVVFVFMVAVGHPAVGHAEVPDELESSGCRFSTVTDATGGPATLSARCEWPLPAARVTAVLRNLEGVMSALRESRRLPDGRLLQVHSLGWPIADRQVTLDWSERSLAGGGVGFEFSPSARQEPLEPGRVQVLKDTGRWEVWPKHEHATELRYEVRYDPGGHLKPWLLLHFQQEGVARSLDEVRAAASAIPTAAASPAR